MIELENSYGHRVQVKVGFSFTTLFWGWWVPLLRKDMQGFLVMLVVQTLLALVYAPIVLASSVAFAVFYNEMHIKGLMSKGYVPATHDAHQFLKTKGIITEGK